MNIPRFDFRKAFILELILIVLFAGGLSLHFLHIVPAQYEIFVLGFIGIVGLIPVAKSTWESILARRINVDLLAAIALIFSILNQQWSSVLFINLMLTSARLFDLYTKRRARISLESLNKLKPSQARVMREGKDVLIPLSDVHVGDIVAVDLGEQVPVDGVITQGEATIDQSSLTGESVPVLRTLNERVHSATVVVSGNILVCAERVGTETTFERMIELVESAQSAKTHLETIGETFANWYIGIMLGVSIVLYAVTKNLPLVLSVVLVVCADDIAVATPIAFITSIGTAAKRGIIVKGTDFLEGVSKITTLVVDKTGTITTGKLAVKNVRSFGGTPLPKMLETSGIVCQRSTHPISKAIAEYIQKNGVICSEPDTFTEKEGLGIIGTKNGDHIIIGRVKFLETNGIIATPEISTAIDEEHEKANNVTLIALNGQIIGLFALADEMRKGARETIIALKNRGLEQVVMLTGDNEAVAQAIAKSAGIDTYHADLLPQDKVTALEKYLGKGKVVAMVGDGVNDAAVLARADIGIAMGGIGSDAAIESADIVLMKDELPKILELRTIADRVIGVAHQNFIIWGTVNAIGLYFVFTGVFDPPRAAAYNFLTDFIPIANSLRLFYYRKRPVRQAK